MSVIDASVFVDALVGIGDHGARARQEVRRLHTLQVPAIFSAEAASALRALVGQGDLPEFRARAALNQILSVRSLQYPFEPFAPRVWELRDNLSVYDAWYVALAEWLGTDLVMSDGRLFGAPGPRCAIRRPGQTG